MSSNRPSNVRRPAVELLAAGDRKTAYFLGMVRGTVRRTAAELEQPGADPAQVLGELLVRLGKLVDIGVQSLDPAARLMGERSAGRKLSGDPGS